VSFGKGYNMVISKFSKDDIVPSFLISSSENCECIYFNVDVDVVSCLKGFKLPYCIYINVTLSDLRDVFRVVPYDINKLVAVKLDQVFIFGVSQKDLTEHIKTRPDKGIICACPICRNKYGLLTEVPKLPICENFDPMHPMMTIPMETYRIKRSAIDDEGYYSFRYEKQS
jgi:hypothetical protein